MNTTYAVQLRLNGTRCVVVGGGVVAARKIQPLLEAGGDVHVISPVRGEELAALHGYTWHERIYRSGDLDGARLAFACSDDPGVNRAVAEDAAAANVWCNVADDPQQCDFFVPATLQRGRLQIAVSTCGASPRLAAAIRDQLASQFGPEYATLAEELARARTIIRTRVADPKIRRAVFDTLCTECSIKLLAGHDRQAWRNWFERVLAHRVKSGVPGRDRGQTGAV